MFEFKHNVWALIRMQKSHDFPFQRYFKKIVIDFVFKKPNPNFLSRFHSKYAAALSGLIFRQNNVRRLKNHFTLEEDDEKKTATFDWLHMRIEIIEISSVH